MTLLSVDLTTIQSALDDVVQLNLKFAEFSNTAAQDTIRNVPLALLVAGVAISLAALAAAFWLSRLILSPIILLTRATEAMAASTTTVTAAIENIASVSEENSAAVEEVSVSTEEVNTLVAEVTSAARALREMAQALQSVVTQFPLAAPPGASSPPVAKAVIPQR